MKIKLLLFFTLLSLAFSVQAAKYGTRVTVNSNNPEGGKVCATHATTTYFIAYTHKKPAAPAESSYSNTSLTIEWESSGGGTKCEVEFYLYAQANPGYKFVRWEQGTSSVATTAEHTVKVNHYTQTPNYNGYTYTAIFEAENVIDSQKVCALDGAELQATAKIVVEPSAPVIGHEFTATVEANKIYPSSNRPYPNMMAEFDHWEVDNEIVSYEPTLTYTPDKLISLKAVYRTKAGRPQVGKYYRIRDVNNRVMSLEGAFKVSVSGATDLSTALIRLAKDTENDDAVFPALGSTSSLSDDYLPLNVNASPGTIFYLSAGALSGTDLNKVNLEAQGKGLKDCVSQDLTITPMDDKMFGYYGLCSTSAKGAGMKVITRDATYANQGDILNVSSFSTVDPFAAFAFQPVDEEHIDTYWFGADADEEMLFDGGFWTSMYTEFPYQCYDDGVEAYYIKEVNGNRAEITLVEDGIVPAGQGVILKCKEAASTFTNRLLPLDPTKDFGTLEGNLLKGLCQLYTSANREGRVNFNAQTMRVFGVSGGNVGFYKLAGDTELAANRAYLDMTMLSDGNNAPAFALTMPDKSGIVNIGADSQSVTRAPDRIFDLEGRPVANPIAGHLYIKAGKKIVF